MACIVYRRGHKQEGGVTVLNVIEFRTDSLVWRERDEEERRHRRRGPRKRQELRDQLRVSV